MNAPLVISQAVDARARRRFLELPFRLYRADPRWVPPLRRDAARVFNGRSAFSRQAEVALFIAERGDRVIGRIAAIDNHAHTGHHGDRTGFFGFIECAEDQSAVDGLCSAAAGWLRRRGLETLRGPLSPSMNGECGVLIRGFDTPPSVLMPYQPPTYARMLETAGFRKCKDLHAYSFSRQDLLPGTAMHERMARLAQRCRRSAAGVTVRSIEGVPRKAALRQLLETFEDLRSANWGHVPMGAEEISEAVRALHPIVDPRMILRTDVDGRAAAFIFSIPDINSILAAAGGRMGPLTLWRLFRARHWTRSLRILGLGVLPRYQGSAVLPLTLYTALQRALASGYQRFEASWVLEDNIRSDRTIRRLVGREPSKVYRIYERPVA